MLRKPTEASFQRFGRYEIVDPGKWTTRTGKDRIEFVHELKDGAGYAYAYRKVLRLDGDTLVIEHELKNTGTKPIATSVYNHNFFTLDRKTTGPDNLVRFPFAPKAARPLNGMAEIRGRELAIARDFQPKENVFTELEGFGTAASDNGFEMENRATGAGVRVAGDRPLSKLLFWSALQDGVPGAVRRRQRRAGPHHLVADHLHVLRGEARRRRAALTLLSTRAIGYRTTVAAGQFWRPSSK